METKAKDSSDNVSGNAHDARPAFTPGPLVAGGNGVHKGTRCVAIAYDPDHVGRGLTPVTLANARLFAASPALYEALRSLLSSASIYATLGTAWFCNSNEHEDECNCEIENACAALALVDDPAV